MLDRGPSSSEMCLKLETVHLHHPLGGEHCAVCTRMKHRTEEMFGLFPLSVQHTQVVPGPIPVAGLQQPWFWWLLGSADSWVLAYNSHSLTCSENKLKRAAESRTELLLCERQKGLRLKSAGESRFTVKQWKSHFKKSLGQPFTCKMKVRLS